MSYHYHDQQDQYPYRNQDEEEERFAPPPGPPPPPPPPQGEYYFQEDFNGREARSGGYEGYETPTEYPSQSQAYGPIDGGYGQPNDYPDPPTLQYRDVEPQTYRNQSRLGNDNNSSDQQGFNYSRCDGNKKALLIGINYIGSDNQLEGCINDAHNIESFIIGRFGYDPSDIVILTDDARDDRQYPSKENILRAMQWLVDGAERDDSLFFHYSGHGTTAPDESGEEADGNSEAICPVDFQENGLIIDSEMITSWNIIVRPLPTGCRLTAIFDSCHSGTVLDLPYLYSTEGTIKEPNYLLQTSSGLLQSGMEYFRGDTQAAFANLMNVAKDEWRQGQAESLSRRTRVSSADVICWSGCKDDQTSADTQEDGIATGAMSYAFITALTKYPDQSYQQLLVNIREEMRGKYTQQPQLSACHPIDTCLRFVA